VGVHVTFIPIVAWGAWMGLTQYGALSGVLFGMAAIVLLTACVLLHEVAHLLYARSRGIGADYIVLLPIGGMTSLDVSALKPLDEARIALVGPLSNLILGLVFATAPIVEALSLHLRLATVVLAALQQPSVLGLLDYLAIANVLLAFFNLIPAFPLDGGRALRALLSRRMSFDSATRRAAMTGRLFSMGLLASGVILFLGGEIYYGVALAIVALALYAGAIYEDRRVQQQATLNAWKVSDVIKADAPTVTPNETLLSAFAMLARERLIPVVVGGSQPRVVGLLTPREVRQSARDGTTSTMMVAHVMRTRFPSVRPGDPLWVAYEKLMRSRLDAIPVVSQNEYFGLIRLSDIRRTVRNPRLSLPVENLPGNPAP